MKLTEQGFTLLEVMVALAIFAVSALVILQQGTLSVQQQSHLEEKTLALWIAENSLAQARLEGANTRVGTFRFKTHLGNRNWDVERNVTSSSKSPLLKTEVRVFRENNSAPIVSLTGYVGKP